MLRLSKLADYAVVVLIRLGGSGTLATANGLAASTGIPEPTVAKVLKQLAGAAIVSSVRGAHGGYRLARPLATVSIANVVDAIDGPIALTACVDGAETCDVGAFCALRGRWDLVNAAVRSALEAITLADMEASAQTRLRPRAADAPAVAVADFP